MTLFPILFNLVDFLTFQNPFGLDSTFTWGRILFDLKPRCLSLESSAYDKGDVKLFDYDCTTLVSKTVIALLKGYSLLRQLLHFVRDAESS